MADSSNAQIFGAIGVPALQIDLSKRKIGKTILLDIVNADVSHLKAKVEHHSHLPTGAGAILSEKEIHELYSNAKDWPENEGITSPYNVPAKPNPLDIDFMHDGKQSDEECQLLSYVVIRLNDPKTKVSFSKETDPPADTPLVVTQAKTDPKDVGRIANAKQFKFGGYSYAHFYITRGVAKGLVNFNVAVEYVQPNGSIVAINIDPGSQNQRP
jgi:hypothetical protein